ncbi:MAG: hypothetical protein QMC90_00110 [Dehalococcoidales bacterium]|nr:hypothetical protein [Dehalococcoidales bacterium]
MGIANLNDARLRELHRYKLSWCFRTLDYSLTFLCWTMLSSVWSFGERAGRKEGKRAGGCMIRSFRRNPKKTFGHGEIDYLVPQILLLFLRHNFTSLSSMKII